MQYSMYHTLKDCIEDLDRHGMLRRISKEVDPHLEMADIHLETFEQGGPALLFENVKGSPFPAASNIYGTYERTDFLFRRTLEPLQLALGFKDDPLKLLRRPLHLAKAIKTISHALPRRLRRKPPSMYGRTRISQLPQIKSWPEDGGAFITLPQVLTLPPGEQDIKKSNLGMYRIQLSGNDYLPDEEVGMHYQIHRGIGIHHRLYKESPDPFRASIFVGGPPAHTFAAIMPMPEELSELLLAGMLAGRRFRYYRHEGHLISADADFVITGEIEKEQLKPEGPFGDHLGYYSLKHDFPFMRVKDVWHRKDAIWHFTVVGRPPQEDSSFGYLIKRIVEPVTEKEFPGILDIHAVDAAGVHPLLLAIGSERYMPFREPQPEEILTQANHLLGKGQTSLAKFLFISTQYEAPGLSAQNIPDFFQHLLERIRWERDLHFYTRTTIDTLDYSGTGWNKGSKLVMAAHGPRIRKLSKSLSECFPSGSSTSLPAGFSEPRLVLPGILALQAPPFRNESGYEEVLHLAKALEKTPPEGIALIVLCDDSSFLSATLDNFLWATFTRANPSHDVQGVGAFTEHKHWGCKGPLIIDARIKPHHAPELKRP